MALDEFLVKNDPCRVIIKGSDGNFRLATPDEHEWWCPFGIQVELVRLDTESRKSSASSRKSSKGRTNVELREQFTLAPGVSQSMTSFKPKTSTQKTESPNSSVSGQASRNPSSAGPITKIKQKSERSLGMDVASHRASMDAAYESQVGGMPETMAGFTRRQSTQPGGGPGSRNGSRPPSRTGSNLSLDRESEDGTRGSGVRRTSSMRSGAGSVGRPPYRQTPVGFGSSTPRKTSTPVKNGRTPSNSSQDRTPMSGRMRSKSYITPRPSELIKSTSATNIPKFVGCYSSTTSSKNSSAANTPLSLATSSERDRKLGRSLIPRYQTFGLKRLGQGTAVSIEALSEVPDDQDEELMALNLVSEVETPSEASGGARSRTPSSSSIPVPTNSYRIRTPSSSSIPIPINQRTRTPTSGTAGNIQRSGSGLSENRSNRTSKTTTSYGADGSRITSTTSSYSASAQSASSASQQQSQKNW